MVEVFYDDVIAIFANGKVSDGEIRPVLSYSWIV